jgi:N-acetylglucosamine kinase-like BadF-type ATPase
MTVYLNDHLAGASLGSSLAEQIRARHQGSPLGEVMESLAQLIDEDRLTLIDLMQRIGAPQKRVKQVSGRIAEKVSQLKVQRRAFVGA